MFIPILRTSPSLYTHFPLLIHHRNRSVKEKNVPDKTKHTQMRRLPPKEIENSPYLARTPPGPTETA